MSDHVVVAGIALNRDQLADALRQYADGKILDDQRARAGSRIAFNSKPWQMAAERLREGSYCPTSSVNADNTGPGFWTPVPILTLTEWVAVGVAGGEGVGPRTIRRRVSEGRFPVFTHRGRPFVRADQEWPTDLRRKRDG